MMGRGAIVGWIILLLQVEAGDLYRTPYNQEQDQNRDRTDLRTDPRGYHIDTSEVRGKECRRCCDPREKDPHLYPDTDYPQSHPHLYPQYHVTPHINITILKGQPLRLYRVAHPEWRKKAIQSNDYYQTLVFDTEVINLYRHFNMFTGKFYCYLPGIYYFSLNVHTWNQKETYVHVMHNEKEVVILYAQPSDRSIMQSQSVMLQLEAGDQVWVRLFKGERENALFSDDYDTYITFNGHLIKPTGEG
ncbi:hypothetical protein DPEC_G00030160 [Dallia pectoralis]|uniref:Uncharacterized protein n=1 Tax=Dallia pectoralis TaxID=75939 RepID=A0ACC2HC71_DALPE|nr:hypothetical protein DPEC_G00030160 [Dallia pectoralis]